MRRLFQEWSFYVVMWIIITVFYCFIYLSIIKGLLEYLNISDAITNDEVFRYMISNYQYLESLIFGFLFGTATFGINFFIDKTSIHKYSFGKTIIIKTILYFLSVFIIFTLMAGLLTSIGISPFKLNEFQEFIHESPLPTVLYISTASFYIMSTLLINFIALMNKKFGPNQMFLIFLGRYNKPRTENRIFMFLDLKSSTYIAEKLGHIIYSQLLQDCFLELNKLIPKYHCEIYQYVGDEAVLTWKVVCGGKNNLEPLTLFFDFQKRLLGKSRYYKQMFGVIPEFKAGLNAGVVTVAEIGDLKREIAYHGDVVNTASRLRSACNEFGEDFLASDYIVRNLPEGHGFFINEIGKVKLKGKKSDLDVFCIKEEPCPNHEQIEVKAQAEEKVQSE